MKTQRTQFLTVLAFICAPALPAALLDAQESATKMVEQAQETVPTEVTEAEAQSAETQSVQKQVDAETEDKVGAKRRQIMEEASNALAETKNALQALEENNTDAALEALEKVTGKLALIVARSPELALAPVQVGVVTHDLYASPETVKAQIKEAEAFLDDGKVQAARDILSVLASETRIRTSHIPLATYPAAITAIAPLIDEGKIDEAKTGLRLALDTLVVTEEVIPLPVVRATALLKTAEELAENDERTIKQNEELADLLGAARVQVKLARALGYGEKTQFQPILEDIKEIEAKTQGSKSGPGFFDAIKEKLSDF
jgi:vacuolar-type H+-ATPase subunit H